MSERIEYHMGRSFAGTRLEDGCPCPKAPCGLVLATGLGVDWDCPEHSLAAGKTIRQTHRADACPAVRFNPATDIHMQMTEDYRAPFWESEQACITAYGHVDKAELARQVQEYDRHVGADDTDLVPVESIQHVWLRMEDPTDEESLMHRCQPEDPGAFPATTIWHYR